MYRSSEEKDLGVTVCDTLHPSLQCAEAANRAMLALGVVNKCFKHLDQESLPMLYVRLHIETCVQAWSPDYRMNIAWTSSTLISNQCHGMTSNFSPFTTVQLLSPI